jgi:hypothetical protein
MRRSLATVGFVVLTLLVAGGGAAQSVSGSADASGEATATTDQDLASEEYSTQNDHADVQAAHDGEANASAEASAEAQLDADEARDRARDELEDRREDVEAHLDDAATHAEAQAALDDRLSTHEEAHAEHEAEEDNETHEAEERDADGDDEREADREARADARSESYGRVQAGEDAEAEQHHEAEGNRSAREEEPEREDEPERQPAPDPAAEIQASHEHWVHAQQRLAEIESEAQIRAGGLDVEHERTVEPDLDESGASTDLSITAAFSATADQLRDGADALRTTTGSVASEVRGLVDHSGSAQASTSSAVDERVADGFRVTGEAGGKVDGEIEQNVPDPDLPDAEAPHTEVSTDTQASSSTEAQTSLTGDQQIGGDL